MLFELRCNLDDTCVVCNVASLTLYTTQALNIKICPYGLVVAGCYTDNVEVMVRFHVRVLKLTTLTEVNRLASCPEGSAPSPCLVSNGVSKLESLLVS